MKAAASYASVALSTFVIGAAALLSSPVASAAPVYKSFYQNSGSICRGIDPTNDQRLARQENRLINVSAVDVTVVCNLMTDVYAVPAANSGVVGYVSIWGRNETGSPRSMSCTMTDGFYLQNGSGTYQPAGGNPKSLAVSGIQTAFSWTPAAGMKFLGPVNVRCIIPTGAELNDTFVYYDFS